VPRDYYAVLFDLDGVLTQTASVHAAVWKRLFDGFLQQRSLQAQAKPSSPSTSMPTIGATSRQTALR
jgi:beta-phosphoglucomutase-like phosphatase (HAD superfamily)